MDHICSFLTTVLVANVQGFPNLNEALELVANRIANDWRKLAWQLDVPEQIIQVADCNNRDDVERKASDVLRKWRQLRGNCASWPEVEKALTDLPRRDIVDGQEQLICCVMFLRKPNRFDNGISI